MKKLLVLGSLMVSFVLFSTNVDAAQSEKFEINENQLVEVDSDFTGDILNIEVQALPKAARGAGVGGVLGYNKSITIYSTSTNFPSTQYYSEFNFNAWYRGTLNFKGAVKSGSNYKATYTGVITRF